MPRFGVGTLLRYEGFQQVGEGAYGHVYKARDRQCTAGASGVSREATVALKRLIIPSSKELAGFPIFALREIKFLKSLKHPNLVRLLDIVSSKGCEDIENNIQTESLKDNESSKHQAGGGFDIQRCGSTFLVFEYVEQCQFIALQLMRALAYLAEKRIMHRDIKSSNILISNELILKLADFGMAREVHECTDIAILNSHLRDPSALFDSVSDNYKEDYTNNVVTIWYRPPELLLGETKYLWHAVDVWSAGCVLAELELFRPLFPGKTVADQLNLIMDVMGIPTEALWPGVSQLVNYPALVQTRFEHQTHAAHSKSSFLATYENRISENLLTFIDRLLILTPAQRIFPAVAIKSSKYLQSCKENNIRPLGLGNTSFHEFETKRNMRRRRDAEKYQDNSSDAANNKARQQNGHSQISGKANITSSTLKRSRSHISSDSKN